MVHIVMLLFALFLATPTVITLIEKNSDTSYFFTLTEEEQNALQEIKEVKAEFKMPVFHFDFATVDLQSTRFAELQLRHDAVTPSIFAPPPNV